MKERFLKELIKRELEFKTRLRKLLEGLTKEVNYINSNRNIIKFGYHNLPLLDFSNSNEAMILNEDYNDIIKLCNLIVNLVGRDKHTYNKRDVDLVNELYNKLNNKIDNDIKYLEELISKE